MSTRISSNQLFNNAQGNIASAREREVISAEKAATSKEIVRASQNPSGWLTAADLKDDLAVRDVIAKNASVALHVLNSSEDVLAQVQEYTQRAKELVLSTSANNPASIEARSHVLDEVRTIYEGVIQAANSRFGNRTLFAGFKSQGMAL